MIIKKEHKLSIWKLIFLVKEIASVFILFNLAMSSATHVVAQSNSSHSDSRVWASNSQPTPLTSSPLKKPRTDQFVKVQSTDKQTIVPPVPEAYRNNIALQRVYVSDIKLVGNTVLTSEQIDNILKKYEGRELAFEELQVVSNQLTNIYIKQGYVNSGVLIPDQEITDGSVKFLAQENSLGDINLAGNQHLSSNYIKSRVRGNLGKVLNVYELEQALRLMQERPLITQVSAQLLPGTDQGASMLNLRVQEDQPVVAAIELNNRRTPNVGEDQGIFSLSHRSLTGRADYLQFNYALAEGVDNIYLGYGIPLNSQDLIFELHYAQGESEIIEDSFKALDIVNDTESWGTNIFQTVLYNPRHKLNLGLSFNYQKTKSYLLDQPYSFTLGEQLGQIKVSALRLNIDWTWRRAYDALSLQSTVSYGLDWLDATDNRKSDGEMPDKDFTSLLVQSYYARQLPWRGAQFLSRLSVQFASAPLLSVEKFAIGGAQTVRGYRENRLVRDEGVVASVELRIPLFLNEAGINQYGLFVAPFLDYGIARDKKLRRQFYEDPHSQNIASVGAGLIWHWWKPLYAELFYGEDLEDLDNDNDSLQERGFHLQLSLQWEL